MKFRSKLNYIIYIFILVTIIGTVCILFLESKKQDILVENRKIENWKNELFILQNFAEIKKTENELNGINSYESISDMKTKVAFVVDEAYKLDIQPTDINNKLSQEFISKCGITSKGEIIYFNGITFDNYIIYFSEGYKFKLPELSGMINSIENSTVENGNLEY